MRRLCCSPWTTSHWRPIFLGPPQAANDAVAPQKGQAIWKTTTFKRGGRVQRGWDDAALARAAQHGWRVMDAWALTQALRSLQDSAWVDAGEGALRALGKLEAGMRGPFCVIHEAPVLEQVWACFELCSSCAFPNAAHFLGFVYAELNQFLLNMVC